jgi:hypothetical protein
LRDAFHDKVNGPVSQEAILETKIASGYIMSQKILLCAWVPIVFLIPSFCHGQEGKKEKVYRGLPSKELESTLKDLKIAFKKAPGNKEGTFFYDFERNNFKIRLYNYNGGDLWIDAVFPKVDLKDINRWNQDAKFSRAVLFKDGDGQSTSLENQLDCRGGVTLGMVRQFIRRFENEVQAFAKSLPKKG